MALICTKCDRAETQREDNETHCRHCGNVVIDGVNARWPFKKQEGRPAVEVSRESPEQDPAGQRPLQLAESIRGKEINMAKKKCSHTECDKPVFVGGLCYKHYCEKNGEYKPKKKLAGRTTRDAKSPKPETKRVRGEAKIPKPAAPAPCEKDTGITIPEEPAGLGIGDIAVIVKFTGYDELLENVMSLAKKEFRTVDCQILYMIDRYFRASEPIMTKLELHNV